MGAVELVVTDLDGTLWFGHEETHPATVAAWHELERLGIPVLVATGRRVTSTRNPLARLGFTPPAVMLNGAIAMDLRTGDRFHSHQYSASDASRVLAAFRDAEMEPCVYVDHADVDVYVGDHPSTHPEHLASLGGTAERANLQVIVDSVPVLMFGALGLEAREPFTAVARSLSGAAETHIARSDQYGGYACTVTPLGLSKWNGVIAYCELAGLDPARVLAIGDGPNDHELLAGAAVAVAPADATADMIRVADHVVASPRDGGWAEIVQYVQ